MMMGKDDGGLLYHKAVLKINMAKDKIAAKNKSLHL